MTLGVILCPFTLAHHLACAIGPRRWWRVPRWLDLLLILAETGCLILVMVSIYVTRSNLTGFQFRWLPKRAIWGLTSLSGLTWGLVMELMLRVLDLLKARCRGIGTGVDILPTSQSKTSWSTHLRQTLLGRLPWQERLPGEGAWIRSLRGLLNFVVIGILVVFSIYQAILAPLAEMGLTPNKEFRASTIQTETFQSTEDITWNVILTWEPYPDVTAALKEAVIVEAIPPVIGRPRISCSSQEISDDINVAVVVFRCRQSVPDSDHDVRLNSFRPLIVSRKDTIPDVALTVNFTQLLGPHDFGKEDELLLGAALNVYVALTENIKDVLSTSRPIYLFPGTHSLAIANLIARQRLRPRELSTLGVDTFRTFLIADLTMTPAGDMFTPENRDSNTATLRIAGQIPAEFTVIQDFRDKSVLSGLSAIGGLATFLSTILVLTLGTNLMSTVLRSKPYSPFGLAHNLDMEQRRLAAACEDRYPEMRSDIARTRNTPGLIAFLCDQLLDLGPLGFKGSDDRRPPITTMSMSPLSSASIDKRLPGTFSADNADNGSTTRPPGTSPPQSPHAHTHFDEKVIEE